MPSDVYLDLTIGTAAPARITISLFTTETPNTCTNFRLLCTNRAPLPTYLSTPIHRIIPTFMLQGGDTTAGNGTGGKSAIEPNGGAIPDENLNWRAIDEAGLVCMANRGKDTGTSQFFITCDAAEWLNGKHTVFGKVVSGMEVVREVERVQTEGDVPVLPVMVTGCGEVEEVEKGRGKSERKRHGETMGQRRGSKKVREGGLDGAADSPERERRDRDRGDRSRRRRHRSRSRSPRRSASPRGERRHRDRSRDRDHRRHDRREREHRYEDADYVRDDQDAEERMRREEQEREAARRYDDDDDADVGEKKGKVTFKGRGSMKYRENKGWGNGGGGRLD